MWTLVFGHHEHRTPTHEYEPTREAAMAGIRKKLAAEVTKKRRTYQPCSVPAPGTNSVTRDTSASTRSPYFDWREVRIQQAERRTHQRDCRSNLGREGAAPI